MVTSAVALSMFLTMPAASQSTEGGAGAPAAAKAQGGGEAPARSPGAAPPSQPGKAATPTAARKSETQPAGATTTAEEAEPVDPVVAYIMELEDAVTALRRELAQARLDADQARRELDEIKQFLEDRKEFGDDFAKYRGVKAAAEREARQKEIQAARERRAQAEAERNRTRRAAQAQRARLDAQADKVARYRRDGFEPVGLDVYISKWAFFYQTKDSSRTRVDYDPAIGNYLRPYPYAQREIDYSEMTISGSIMNGTDAVRNIGVAITFFDEDGNQVGHEIVEIANARPDVPYPFTSTIAMALNRPFDSSSTYVLYADRVDGESPTTNEAGASGMKQDDRDLRTTYEREKSPD